MNRAANELLRELVAMIMAKCPPDTPTGAIVANLSITMLNLVSQLIDSMVKLIMDTFEASGGQVSVILPKRPESGESTT
jgi:hypothetical protein